MYFTYYVVSYINKILIPPCGVLDRTCIQNYFVSPDCVHACLHASTINLNLITISLKLRLSANMI
jgi:hypothetical protein